MPGTVQVSILELTGLPSSNSSSSMSIKVSLGKHTCEAEGANGDFLLPLATLRDNLVVKVHDTEGNEIAHTGVKSRLIAEKGSWDDLFPLEGGGHVHMRLKFSLNDEERNRIRNMRETALKKKQDEIVNRNKRELQAAVASSGGRDEMFSAAAISDEAPSFDLSLEASSKPVSSESSSKPGKSSASIQDKEDDPRYNLKDQIPLEKTLSKVKEDDPFYDLKDQSPLEETAGEVKEDDSRYNLKIQSPLEETPSEMKEDDSRYNLKIQSPLEKTPSKVDEDDRRYDLKEQSSQEEQSSKIKEDDSRYNLKEQSQLEKKPSKVKEGDQHYNLKEQSPLEKPPIQVKEDDLRYNFKEQSLLKKTPRKVKEDDQHYSLKEQNPLSKIKEDDRRYNFKEQRPLEKSPSKVKEGDSRYNVKEQSPLKKAPSKVRNTVAAFENSLHSQGWMAAEKAQSSRETASTQDVDNMEHKSKEISVVEEIKGKDPLDSILESEEKEPSNELRRSSNLEQHETSARVLDSLSEENRPSNSVTEQEYASGDHLKDIGARMSTEVPGSQCSCRNFRGWIFLEEEICLCIASENRVVTNLLGDYSVNPKPYPGKLVDEVTSSKDVNRSRDSKNPESSHSSGPNGQPGQMMKIVIMVGFGLLVLFTRKRKPR